MERKSLNFFNKYKSYILEYTDQTIIIYYINRKLLNVDNVIKNVGC